MSKLLSALAGVAAGLLLVAAASFAYFRFGLAPVAVSDKPMPLEKTLAGWALDARVDRDMPRAAPIEPSAATFAAGAKVYVDNCAMCHGLPENRSAPFAKALFPPPPQLFRGKGVTDDPPGATYWVVTHGIRLTGMPAFEHLLDDTERWQVALLLNHAHELPPDVARTLQTAELAK